jgi:hypothetical protein
VHEADDVTSRRCARLPDLQEFRPQVLVCSDHVRYVDKLRRYELFPPEQLLVLIYDAGSLSVAKGVALLIGAVRALRHEEPAIAPRSQAPSMWPTAGRP